MSDRKLRAAPSFSGASDPRRRELSGPRLERRSVAPRVSSSSGAGARITDVDGRSYLDYVGSWGPLIHGHAPAGVVESGHLGRPRSGDQLRRFHAGEVELAERIREFFPSIESVRLVSSGTEATMSALRLARAATGRSSDRQVRRLLSRPLRRASRARGLRRDDTRRARQSRRSRRGRAPHARRPLQRSRLGRRWFVTRTSPRSSSSPSRETWAWFRPSRRLSVRSSSHRGPSAARLLIFDEVITGFRLARGGYQEICGVRPDLTCLGKVIGGGLPVGAYGGRADLMKPPRARADRSIKQVPCPETLSPSQPGSRRWHSSISDPPYERLERAAARLEAGLEARSIAHAGLRPARRVDADAVLRCYATSASYEDALAADTDRFARFFRACARARASGCRPPSSRRGSYPRPTATRTSTQTIEAVDACASRERTSPDE